VTFRLQYAAISDVGRVRKDNQDAGYAGPWLLTVCDGVGGAARCGGRHGVPQRVSNQRMTRLSRWMSSGSAMYPRAASISDVGLRRMRAVSAAP